jgi:hypothetical protein
MMEFILGIAKLVLFALIAGTLIIAGLLIMFVTLLAIAHKMGIHEELTYFSKAFPELKYCAILQDPGSMEYSGPLFFVCFGDDHQMRLIRSDGLKYKDPDNREKGVVGMYQEIKIGEGMYDFLNAYYQKHNIIKLDRYRK